MVRFSLVYPVKSQPTIEKIHSMRPFPYVFNEYLRFSSGEDQSYSLAMLREASQPYTGMLAVRRVQPDKPIPRVR